MSHIEQWVLKNNAGDCGGSAIPVAILSETLEDFGANLGIQTYETDNRSLQWILIL